MTCDYKWVRVRFWPLVQMKREIDILTTDECHSLLSACSSKAPTGIRNQALIVVLWRTCLRIQEALDLLPKDVSGDSIRVHSGKGDRARTVGLDPESSAVVERWVTKRREMGFKPSQRLFCTLKGDPLDHPTAATCSSVWQGKPDLISASIPTDYAIRGRFTCWTRATTSW